MIVNGMLIADRYEIVGKIGTGGMSDVYKAMDRTLGRYVAIKVLKAEFCDDMTFVTKFRTEAQSAAGLEHPNIVNVYDVGSQDGIYYIIMEYIEGITLKTYIAKKGRLNYKETLSIAIQVGRGIQAAHAKNIIHRDIKPQNIMISTDGKVKVTDFGIARAVSENTIHSDVMGSVHYASPEQARNGYVSNKSDIYSLGIVMYEMVTGRVPFDGESTVAIAIKHLQDEMVSPSAYAPDLPVSLEKIILKCTQKSADRRYESMESLLVDLRKALLSPNEDFVTLVPFNQGKTRVLSDEEVHEIQDKTSAVSDTSYLYNNNDADDEDEYEYDDWDDDDDEEYDDDDRGFMNRRMERVVNVMRIVILIIIIVIVLYIVGSFLGLFKFGTIPFLNSSSNTATVTEQQEDTTAAETADTEETKTDADAEDQAAAEGQIEVPSVIGMTEEDAKTKLSNLGLRTQVTSEQSDTVDKGDVISQNVAAGSYVDDGSTVEITVSSGSGNAAKDAINKLLSDNSSVDTYYCKTTIKAPTNVEVESADIVLYGADSGDVLGTFNTDTFPYTVEVHNIEGETSGTLEITWHYTDNSGQTADYVQTAGTNFKQE